MERPGAKNERVAEKRVETRKVFHGKCNAKMKLLIKSVIVCLEYIYLGYCVVANSASCDPVVHSADYSFG